MTTTTSISTPLILPCGTTLPNRLVKAAMTEGLADAWNCATPAHATLYEIWAKGGSGVLLTGNVQIHRDYLERPGNIVIEAPQSDDQLAGLRAMASAATDNGAHIWMQISHAGRQTPAAVSKEPLAPSAVPVEMPGGQFGTPRALEESEILDLIERFAFVAGVARETGFSGVQIHSAHGYLLSEFLSPRVNRRTDQWGGSLENRARFLLQTIAAVREEVGSGFPVSVKLNSSDFQKGGFSFDECLQVVAWLEEAGVDVLEISGGNYEQPSMMGLEGSEPVFDEAMRESTRAREAYFMDYAQRIRAVARIPLMVTGGFRSVDAMNDALTHDNIDLIGIGRPLCGDPAGSAKLLSGEVAQVPAWEERLRIGPGILGPNSRFDLIKTLNVAAAQGWFCVQILRMGHGEAPDTKMSAFKAMRVYMKNESTAAKRMLEQR